MIYEEDFVYFLLLVALPPVWAQVQNGANGEKVDVVYLTNGVVVRGHIVSSGDGEMVVRTLDGQTKRFALMEVETTSSELVQAKPEIKKDFYEPGFRGFVELGYGFNVNNTSDVFEFNFIGGYRFSKRFFLGLGIGYGRVMSYGRGVYYYPYDYPGHRYYDNGEFQNNSGFDCLSIFLDSHFYMGKIMPKTKHIFYVGVRMGAFDIVYPEKFYFSLSANYQYRLKNRHSLNFSLAYSCGQAEYWESVSSFKKEFTSDREYFWRYNCDGTERTIQTISLRVSYGF